MITLEMTCGACPEQYDAFLDGNLVGYFRLRHGSFTVQYPHAGGDVVYAAITHGDGCFEDYERDVHLEAGKAAILLRMAMDSKRSDL